jgi:predicted RNA-binding Zn-ribbon protein involved in translation (DUF1610 family)
MQTSLSEIQQTPASRRLISDRFLPDDEALSASLPASDFSEAVLSNSPDATAISTVSTLLGGRTRAETVECPKCGKHSIIRRSPNAFNCLNCNFHKELPPLAMSKPYRMTENPRQLIYTQLPTARPSLDELGEISKTDKIQPFVFAAIAVILGVIIL